MLSDAYEELDGMGSRLAEVYYGLARTRLLNNDPRPAAMFRTGWQLQPIERERLFRDPVLAYLSAEQELFELLALSSPLEPRVSPQIRRPGNFPAAARLSRDDAHER